MSIIGNAKINLQVRSETRIENGMRRAENRRTTEKP